MRDLTMVKRAPRELMNLYWGSGVSGDVPALAWFLLSSLVPLALGVTALAAVVLGDYAHAQQLAARMSDVLPKDAHDQVVDLILRTKRDSPLLIAASIIGMVWMCSGIVGVLDGCLTRLLGRGGGGMVRRKLRNLAVSAMLTTAIVLMVIAASAGTGLVRRLHLDATLIRLVVPLVFLTVMLLLVGSVYLVLAGGSLRWRAALAGSAVSSVFLLATPTAAGYYLRLVAGRTPVELFLMLAGVLFTCYLASTGLLLGVGVTARVELGRPLGATAEAPAQ